MHRISRALAVKTIEADANALPLRFRGCTMCACAAGYGPDAEVLAENESAVAILDRFATRRGHVMVIMREHVERVGTLTWPVYRRLQRLSWESAVAIERVLSPRRVFVAALGSPDPLLVSFPHLHVHVIPVYEGGPSARPARVLTWARGVLLYDEGEAREVASALRREWPAKKRRHS